MKKLVLLLVLVVGLFAEVSFDQVQELLKNRQYSKALVSLEAIQVNHPNESIVYYATAQAKAGFGDLIGAKIALDKAKALNSKLSYAKPEAVKALEIAVQPRVELVQTFERADKINYGVYGFIISFILIIAGLWYFMFKKSEDDDDIKGFNGNDKPMPKPSPSPYTRKPFENDVVEKAPSPFKDDLKPEDVYKPVLNTKPNRPSILEDTRMRREQRPETFSVNYGTKRNHGSASDTIVAGVAGVALGATIANMLDNDNHEVTKSEPTRNEYFAKSYEEPEPRVSNSWGGSNEPEPRVSNSWGGSNESDSGSWGGSNEEEVVTSSSWGGSNESDSGSWGGSND